MEEKDNSNTVRKVLIGDKSYNKLAIIAAVLCFLGGFFFLLPLIGFILGIVSLAQINKTKEKGKLLAVGAVILGFMLGIAPILLPVIMVAR